MLYVEQTEQTIDSLASAHIGSDPANIRIICRSLRLPHVEQCRASQLSAWNVSTSLGALDSHRQTEQAVTMEQCSQSQGGGAVAARLAGGQQSRWLACLPSIVEPASTRPDHPLTSTHGHWQSHFHHSVPAARQGRDP